MLIDELTMDEFREGLKRTRTVIIPFGSVEEHGTHLPLSTDTIIPVEILKVVQERKDIFVAPPVNYGVCTSTSQHPGTISISPETLRRLTYDLISDSYRKGLRNFILISGHAGGLHMNAIKEVAETLAGRLEGIRLAVFSPYELLWSELSEIAETENDSHAGEIETSLILAVKSELVKGRAEEEYPHFPKPLIVSDKLKYWPGGVWGNPAKASREKGERVIRLVVEKILEIIDMIERDH
jgi:creatinine amidohydrolase